MMVLDFLVRRGGQIGNSSQKTPPTIIAAVFYPKNFE